MKDNLQKELAEISAKCDLIIELINGLSSDPDFIISRMQEIAFRQNAEIKRKNTTYLKLLPNDK